MAADPAGAERDDRLVAALTPVLTRVLDEENRALAIRHWASSAAMDLIRNPSPGRRLAVDERLHVLANRCAPDLAARLPDDGYGDVTALLADRVCREMIGLSREEEWIDTERTRLYDICYDTVLLEDFVLRPPAGAHPAFWNNRLAAVVDIPPDPPAAWRPVTPA